MNSQRLYFLSHSKISLVVGCFQEIMSWISLLCGFGRIGNAELESLQTNDEALLAAAPGVCDASRSCIAP